MTTSKNGVQGARVPTDTALITAARRGDVDAFDSLADRHRDAAVKLARRTIHGSAEAMVETAIAAARTELAAGHGPATAFRPHLLTILRRQNSTGPRRARRARTEAIPGGPDGRALPPVCVEHTAKAFRGLTEDAQVALWHTEVEGEPLLETGKLLGLDATGAAELSFAARDTLRAAQLLEHRAAISTPECRWTTNRLGGFSRNTLSEPDTAKVTAHLDECELCAAVAPAVRAIESDLALLVATAVLGPAAAAYLGRDGAGQAGRGRLAALMRDAARPVAVAMSAIALITAGLLGTLAFADEDSAPDKAATPSTFTAIPVAPTTPLADSGPDSGNGSTGRVAPEATPRPTPRPVPATLARPVSSDVKTDPVKPAPQAEESEGTSVDLGITSLTITPGAGLLGLPGLSLG